MNKDRLINKIVNHMHFVEITAEYNWREYAESIHDMVIDNYSTIYCVLNENKDLCQTFISKEDCSKWLSDMIESYSIDKDLENYYNYPCWVYPRNNGYSDRLTFPTYTIREFIKFVEASNLIL